MRRHRRKHGRARKAVAPYFMTDAQRIAYVAYKRERRKGENMRYAHDIAMEAVEKALGTWKGAWEAATAAQDYYEDKETK